MSKIPNAVLAFYAALQAEIGPIVGDVLITLHPPVGEALAAVVWRHFEELATRAGHGQPPLVRQVEEWAAFNIGRVTFRWPLELPEDNPLEFVEIDPQRVSDLYHGRGDAKKT